MFRRISDQSGFSHKLYVSIKITLTQTSNKLNFCFDILRESLLLQLHRDETVSGEVYVARFPRRDFGEIPSLSERIASARLKWRLVRFWLESAMSSLKLETMTKTTPRTRNMIIIKVTVCSPVKIIINVGIDC